MLVYLLTKYYNNKMHYYARARVHQKTNSVIACPLSAGPRIEFRLFGVKAFPPTLTICVMNHEAKVGIILNVFNYDACSVGSLFEPINFQSRTRENFK